MFSEPVEVDIRDMLAALERQIRDQQAGLIIKIAEREAEIAALRRKIDVLQKQDDAARGNSGKPQAPKKQGEQTDKSPSGPPN